MSRGVEWELDEATGCWEWLKGKDGNGYPYGYAHRRYWETANGPRPDGYDIHHLCKNPGCVNPDHLEALPPVVHLLYHHLDEAGRSVSDIAAVRADRARGLTYRAIAEKRDLPLTTVYEWCSYAWGVSKVSLPTKTCEGCGTTFSTRRPDKRFCTPPCRQAHNARKARDQRKAA